MKIQKIIQKALAIIILLLAVHTTGNAQKAEDIFRHGGDDIVWLGLDFTQVKLVGELGTVGKDELIPLFDDINRLVIAERSKYNFQAALRKDEVPFNLEIVTRLNSEIDPGKAIAYSSSDEGGRLDEEAISVLVKQYKVEKSEGIGLVFFIEKLDKVTEKGTMWVTFFDLSDRNVLLTEKMWGVAGGISFRNHWARSVYEVINKIKDTKYAEWKFRVTR